jgi:tagatose-6-phosphate ketose/aldose isomerase
MKSYFTIKEIRQQPEIWQEVFRLIELQQFEIQSFLSRYLESENSEVIFTGAGSSFYIGEMVQGLFQYYTGISSRAVSSTEIVTHPELFINPEKKTLLISFARSGNSPESVAAIQNAENISSNVGNLIICCNKDGKLMKMGFKNGYKLLLPKSTNDKGLAMTSSVTSMALTALLIGRLNSFFSLKTQIDLVSKYADKIISKGEHLFNKIISSDFERAVFLGSGPFLGVAREAHLKLQELTNGKIICKFDSFLGFRHGPKAVVNDKTLLVYFFSNNKYVRQYEQDLVNSIRESSKPAFSLGISENKPDVNGLDQIITLAVDNDNLDEGFLMLSSLVVAQLLSFYKSVNEGFNPDTPSTNGAIHRVVQGVNIYEYETNNMILEK